MKRRLQAQLRKHDRDDARRDRLILRHVFLTRVQINVLFALLRELNCQQENIMAAIDDLRTQNARQLAALQGMASDVAALKALLEGAGSGGLNAADTAEALAMATSLADQMEAQDASYPGAGTGTGAEVNTVNQAGQDNGIGSVGSVIANDDPRLAEYKANSWVDTSNSPTARRR